MRLNDYRLLYLRNLISGVTVTPLDESTYEIFAPNKDAMDEAKEMMKTWLDSKVH